MVKRDPNHIYLGPLVGGPGSCRPQKDTIIPFTAKGGKRISKKQMQGGFLGTISAIAGIATGIGKLIKYIKDKKAQRAKEKEARGSGGSGSIFERLKALSPEKKKAFAAEWRKRSARLNKFYGIPRATKGSGADDMVADVTNQKDVKDLARKIASWKVANPDGFLNPDSRKKLMQMIADHKKKTGGSIFDTYYKKAAIDGGSMFDSYDNAAVEGGDCLCGNGYNNAALEGGFGLGSLLHLLGPLGPGAVNPSTILSLFGH